VSAQTKQASPAAQPGREYTAAERAKLEAGLQAKKEAMSKPGAGPTVSRIDLDAVRGTAPPSPTEIRIAASDLGLSPDRLREKYKGRLAKAFVDYESSCEPAGIAPGGSGKLVVIMVLRGDAVMVASGANIDMEPQQGALSLGAPAFLPAGPARVAPAFRGKPAYDEFAAFEVPFSVAADAPAGPQTVGFLLTYELYNGTTGGWIERFRDNVTAEVRVQPTGAAATATGENADAGAGTAPDLPRAQTMTAPARVEPAAPDAGDPAPASVSSGKLELVAGCGAVVGLLVLLLVIRRRA
jgi:hypothetical protein